MEDTLQQRGVHILNNFFSDTGSNCLEGFIEPFYDRQVYKEGLGLVSIEDFRSFPDRYTFRLLYAKKKTGQTYGTPHHINLDEVAFENQLKIYPNPTADNLNIELPDEIQSMKIVIIDQLGRKLIEQSINRENQAISVENLTPGTYFIKTESGKAIPFVKQ